MWFANRLGLPKWCCFLSMRAAPRDLHFLSQPLTASGIIGNNCLAIWKIRQAGGDGRPWRLKSVFPREPDCTFLWNINDFPLIGRQMPPRPGGAKGRNIGRSPEGARLTRMPGRFPGGGWRVGRDRRRPGMTGCGGEPPGLRNEPNSRKQKLHQIVTSDRADSKRRGSPGSAAEWRLQGKPV